MEKPEVLRTEDLSGDGGAIKEVLREGSLEKGQPPVGSEALCM